MITTIEELEALPDGARIIDACGNALTLHKEEGEVPEWIGANFSDWSSRVALPAHRIIPATISREKLSELEVAIKAALNAVAVSLGATDDPDQWDMEARAATEATLKTLGIEVNND